MSRRKPHFYFQNLLETLDALQRECIQEAREAGPAGAAALTTRQGAVLSQLKLMQDEQPEGISLKELAGRLQMTVPAASQLVETLVSKGYLLRTPSPDDRRAVRIKLSEGGEEQFADVYERFHSKLDERARALTAEELHTLAGIVRKMQG